MAEVYPQRRPDGQGGRCLEHWQMGILARRTHREETKNNAREVPLKRPVLPAMRRLPACQNFVKRIDRIPIHIVTVLLRGAAVSHPPGIPPSDLLYFL